MVLFIIGLILAIVGYVYFFLQLKKFALNKEIGKKERKIENETRTKFLVLALGIGILTILSSLGLVLFQHWSLKAYEWILLILGSYLFGSGIATFIGAFYLYYWCLDLDKKQRKFSRKTIFFAAILAVIGLWIFSEAIAHQDIYPLVNRIDFKYGLITVTGDHPNDTGFGIMFYGIVIVVGACICYLITDHECYKKYGEHGLIDTLFVLAFFAGIIGARLWSCFGLNAEFRHYYAANPGEIFRIMDGGLAIQGGVILGVVVGVSYVLIFRRYMSLRFIMDVAIPSILIAQIMGRWGNFFNREVYGLASPEWLNNLLPTIVRNNMIIDGEAKVPLFWIESLFNILGFILITVVIGKVCKVGHGKGYQAACYFIWYGLARILLEGLRDNEFQNGNSKVFGWVMFGGGILLLGAFISLHYLRMSKGLEDKDGNKI